jgi:6-phosphogluconolactonase
VRAWRCPGTGRCSPSATSAASRPTIRRATSAWCARRCSTTCRSRRPRCCASRASWAPTRPRPRTSARCATRSLRDTLRATLDASDDATFDVALLGVGADGHTASLFPGDPLLDDVGDRWVAPVPVPPPDAPHARVTLTLACLRRARGVLVLVEGARKAPVVAAARAAGDQVPHDALPAVRVRGRAWTRWLVDRAAAGEADVG